MSNSKSRAVALKPTLPEPATQRPLSQNEASALDRYESIIRTSRTALESHFFKIAEAFYQIKTRKLYSGSHSSFAAYFKDRWGYARSHAYRIADAGGIIDLVSPNGDTWKLLTTESHFRPLASLDETAVAEVFELLENWREHFKPRTWSILRFVM